jgi:diguanylate cyclase (GGDEF)-like protein
VLVTRAGDELPIEDCAAPIRDPDGRVRGVVVTFRDASERRRAEAHLVRMAHHDPLTGLANRVLFEKRLRRTVAHARRAGNLVAVLLLDLDEFKTVNDTLGHASGDALLVAAADRIRANVRETDTVARLGGDEIAIIQPDLDSLESAPGLADKFVRIFNRPFVIDGTEITTTASVGMTIFPNDAKDPDSILELADKAMYRAKAAGRNRFNMSAHLGPSTGRRHEFSEQELRRALERSEFEIHFQPIFSLQPHRLTGAEALVRWNHPEKGLIPASRFIRDAERIGIFDSIVTMTLKESCAAIRSWLGSAPDMKISINVSPAELRRRDLVNAVSEVLKEESLPPGHLELEVGERSAIEERQSQTAINIRGLRNLGLMISLDQFGHEYASMLSMTASPVGAVKIDRSVVMGIPKDSRAVEIVKATVEISQAFDITVVAVGVETEEQMQSLRDAGCHQAQGNLFGSAMATNEFFDRYLM